jgi:GTPase involved in cell partitioning and DNA repair
MKQLQAANALYNKKLKEKRRVATAAKREEREKEKAEKAARKAAEKAAQNTQKAIPPSQKGKREASSAFSSKSKQQKRSGSAAAPIELEPAVPAKLSRRGRTVKLPGRYTQSN